MSPAQIRDAVRDGRLAAVLRGEEPQRQIVGLDPAKVERLLDDPEALAAYRASVEGTAPSERDPETPPPSADQGAHGTPALGTRDWFAHATPGEVRRALREGQLDDILRGGLQ